MAKIHIVFTKKGGVGKTTVCAFLAQKLRDDGSTVHVYDTDPSNATLTAFKTLNAEYLSIMKDDRIDQSKFDELINFCAGCAEDDHVVIDVGSSNFIEFSSYLHSQGIIDALSTMGSEINLHVLIKSGPEQDDTIYSFDQIMEAFGDSPANMIVWLNEYTGTIQHQNKTFEDMAVFKKHKKNITGMITIPEPKVADTFGVDMKNMLTSKMTFSDVANSDDWGWINKMRIAGIQKDIYLAINKVV